MITKEPLHEQYRIASIEWVDLDNAARLLEENKSIVLETMKDKLIEAEPKMAENRAERIVKASGAWKDYIKEMVEAKTKARHAYQKLKWIEMRDREHTSIEATKRAEMNLR